MTAPVRYRFAEFVLSPRRRLLLRNGVAVALIPKYFDLLLLLVVRRREAVSKQTIFGEVWSDVVVSDGALSQAVRTIRRTLGDDSREPRFIRTVSRHGYQFVWTAVAEEADEDDWVGTRTEVPPSPGAKTTLEQLVERLLASRSSATDARDLAERLHALGTAEAVAAIRARPHHAWAVAVMRDARWNVAGSGAVPILDDPERLQIALALVRLRLSDAGRMIARRWASAASAGAIGGAAAGTAGGLALHFSPSSGAPLQGALALGAIGAGAGFAGAAGVAAGLTAAEAIARSRRGLALTVCGAVSGALIGASAVVIVRAMLESLFGIRAGSAVATAGGLIDGLVLGAAAGASYALATKQPPGGGLAAPTGRRRLAVVAIVGAACALGATGLATSGRLLVGGLVNEVARSSKDAQLNLGPLGYLVGEPGFGPLTQALLSGFEGGVFGSALAWGLTRRPRQPRE